MEQKPYHHGNLRNTLIEVGIALLNEQGQENFSLRKVATKCGVSHAAPYSHFENKEALIEAMKQHVTKQFTQVLEQTIQQHKNDLDIMLYLGNAYISFFVEHKQYFTFLYGKSGIQFDFTENGILKNNYTPCNIFKKAAFDIMEKIEYPPQKRLDALIAMIALVHGITAMLTTQQILYEGDCKNLLKNSISANALFTDIVTKQKQKKGEFL
ncbi:TetR/AcrR family transcriptional regulator [Clostridium sp. MD294]|uniref:TetR/AcrR family transcriptional regulator n=1 Tax=Clostridium sp. MD294 TaxID=97138 RepID=UPI0002CAD399|nr:TetR/AcrR family transcriptional regulator [Clostridium sp. MD294]NDO45893.1 TetR/AcrR family transcriptional regulator [Clostridium sp. MD294]USF30448.1 hypothetical protein C820_001889 [Clostridium sp. MD294]